MRHLALMLDGRVNSCYLQMTDIRMIRRSQEVEDWTSPALGSSCDGDAGHLVIGTSTSLCLCPGSLRGISTHRWPMQTNSHWMLHPRNSIALTELQYLGVPPSLLSVTTDLGCSR